MFWLKNEPLENQSYVGWKNKNSLETLLGLEWCIGVETLGIHFSCDQEQVMKQNSQDR